MHIRVNNANLEVWKILKAITLLNCKNPKMGQKMSVLNPVLGTLLSNFFDQKWPFFGLRSTTAIKISICWSQNPVLWALILLTNYIFKLQLGWKMTFDGKRPLMGDDLWLKTTFDGRYLWWKTTFDGTQLLIRQHFMDNKLGWKATFYKRWPLIEDNILWKTTFDGKHLWWETASIGR